MSFVTLTVYKLDNLRNQLMNNRLLFPRFIAFASCQDRVGRPMQPVLQMGASILSKSEVLTTKLTLSGMDDRFGRKKKKSGSLCLAGLTRTVWSGWPVLTILLRAHGLCYEGSAFSGRPKTPRVQNKLSSKLWYMKYMKYMKYFNIWNTSYITSQNKLSFKIISKRRSWFCRYHVFLQLFRSQLFKSCEQRRMLCNTE